MNVLAYASIAILSGLFLVWGSAEIESKFLSEFLKTNLLLLLPALMAINVTTAGVVMSKLRELGDKHHTAFSPTIRAIKHSFYEQTILMVITALFQIVADAKGLEKMGHNLPFIVQTLICACFIYSLIILHDTAKAIFVIMEFEAKDHNGPQDGQK